METQVERIRRICEEKGIRVTVMERDLGYGRGFLNPKKIKTVPAQRLVEIATYLNVSVQYLATGEKSDNEDLLDYLQMIKDNPGLRVLLDHTKNASREDIEAVVRVLGLGKKNEN